MPISNNASYVPTMNEFLAHWSQVDVALGTSLLVPSQPQQTMDRTGFLALQAQLIADTSAVIDKLNDREIARGEINLRKAALLDRLREFTQLVNTYYQGTAFAPAVPKMPSISDGQEKFLAPMRDMVSLWGKLNNALAPSGITLPLVLSDNKALADVTSELALLDSAHITEASAAQSVVIARKRRDETKALAYTVMKNYRQAVPPRCVMHPVLVETLPALTPAAGHTPDAVAASAVFQAPDQSKVVYDASAEADLARYELRGNPGDKYDEDDAVVIATNLPADLREFVTNFGLTQPGAVTTMKVYVVLTTGNEAGSAAMTVQRPL